MSNNEMADVKPMDDRVPSHSADYEQLQQYEQAKVTLSKFRVPILAESQLSRERIFYAAFDGTGHSTPPKHHSPSNVRSLFEVLSLREKRGDAQIAARYQPGPCMRKNSVSRWIASRRGRTAVQQLEVMYSDLVRQATEWKRRDPNIIMRVVSLGFSAGATQAAVFTNLLHERGIADPSDPTAVHACIASPGVTPQVVALYAPIAAGVPRSLDRCLAPSVVSGFQILPMDEFREGFRSEPLLAPGFSADGRFLSISLPGSQADVGGGYIRDGLARRTYNLMIDYLNALRR